MNASQRRIVLLVGFALFIVHSPTAIRAADGSADIAALQEQVRQLEARVADLESRVNRPTTRPVSQLGPIANGDLLRISINDLIGPGVAMVREFRVGDDGSVGLPIVGPVHLAGLTLVDGEVAIEKAYRKANLIQNAQNKIERWESAADSTAARGPLRPGEFVRVIVSDLRGPGLETIVNSQVDENGDIDMPLIHRVRVGGLSESAAGQAVDRGFRDANLISNAGATVLRTGGGEGL
jgi:protein involved in polysaccharide export with SLBB domain